MKKRFIEWDMPLAEISEESAREKNMTPELNEIRNILKQSKKKIRTKYKAEIIGVFGSYVRGEQTEESDLDILVRFFDGATLFDLSGLSIFLEEELGIKADIVSERAVRDELKEAIMKEAVAV